MNINEIIDKIKDILSNELDNKRVFGVTTVNGNYCTVGVI